MAPFAPFETAPQLAVGCSGGPDSMALTFLTAEWAAARGGNVTALIVDHGIRENSREEAKYVASVLAGEKIHAVILTRTGEPIQTSVQDTARRSRYALLTDWCRNAGVLHLLLAHHREDQAETVILRQRRKSGDFGLAGMPGVRETAAVRIIRPLIPVSKQVLRNTIDARAVPFVQDPSNEDRKFARVRVRQDASHNMQDAFGISIAAGNARRGLDVDTSQLLGRTCRVFDEGYAVLKLPPLLEAGDFLAKRSIVQTVSAIGGHEYGPRSQRAENLWIAIKQGKIGKGRTLAGCRIVPHNNDLLICREPHQIADRQPMRREMIWDNRFCIRMGGEIDGISVEKMGKMPIRVIEDTAFRKQMRKIPPYVRPSLPVVRKGNALVSIPHIGLNGGCPVEIAFLPKNTVTSAPFQFASDGLDTI